jgi:hypothetical protein
MVSRLKYISVAQVRYGWRRLILRLLSFDRMKRGRALIVLGCRVCRWDIMAPVGNQAAGGVVLGSQEFLSDVSVIFRETIQEGSPQ